MRLLMLLPLTLLGCELGKPPVAPGEEIAVAIMPATYAEDSDAPPAVKSKCKFEQKIAKEVVANTAGSSVSTHGASGKVLTMTVVAMRGVEPDWQGERTVIVRGEFSEDGVESGTFRIRRSFQGGVFSGMVGVCNGLDDIAEIMGEDIAQWLRDPKPGSELEE